MVSVGLWLQLRRPAGEEISYSRFLRDLEADQLDQLDIHGRAVHGRYKDGKTFRAQLPYIDPQLADDIAQHSEAFFDEESAMLDHVLMFGLPALVLGAAIGFVIRRR